MFWQISIRIATFAAFGLLFALPVDADLVRLVGGGQIRGQVHPDSLSGELDDVIVRTLSGSQVTIARDHVELIKQRSLSVEDYETRARSIEHTVEAHLELAEWCRVNGLPDQRHEQLELLLDLDPDHADARRILGHVKYHGEWMTRHEWMTARGYVKHGGRYVTQQELDLLEKSDAEREAEQAWYPKVRLWFTWATGRNSQRAAEGLTNLSAITDADAVPALINFMGSHESDGVRMKFVEILSNVPGDKPVGPLAGRSLFDEDEQVRVAARRGIDPAQYERALEFYVPELRNDSNTIVQRAAAAIGEFGNMDTVPYLIEALVTTHKWKIQVPANTSMSFGTGPGGQVSMNNGSLSGLLPAEVEGLARTGQLPYGAIVQQPFQRQRMQTLTIKGDVKNSEVLAALKRITEQDFGYNEREWQIWWETRSSS